jgi:hypothetical protein
MYYSQKENLMEQITKMKYPISIESLNFEQSYINQICLIEDQNKMDSIFSMLGQAAMTYVEYEEREMILAEVMSAKMKIALANSLRGETSFIIDFQTIVENIIEKKVVEIANDTRTYEEISSLIEAEGYDLYFDLNIKAILSGYIVDGTTRNFAIGEILKRHNLI